MNSTTHWKNANLWSDIRFWLAFFALIRLVGITNAPLEMSHSWRQTLTSMTARNFLEEDAHILYPKIDLAGEKTGIIGTEFPIYNYLIYGVAKIFGYTHWFGRIINLLITTLGVFYFYKLLQETISERVAFFSAFVLNVSVWFGFARKIMPDTFSVALLFIGLYFGFRFLRDGGWGHLALYFSLCTLGMLSKIPALSLFAIFAIAPFVKGVVMKRVVILYSVGAVGVGLVFLWYFYWVPHLIQTYGYEHYFPRTLKEGWIEIMGLWPQLLEKFYFVAFSSFIAFACFLVGVYYVFRDRKSLFWPLICIGIISAIFALFIVKTGLVFPLHSYYVVPFVPVMALVLGYFLSQIKPRFAYILLALISIESVANQQDDIFLRKDELYKQNLEAIADKYIPTNDLVIVNDNFSPQMMYFLHRKGWSNESQTLADKSYVDSLATHGAKYMVWNKRNALLPIYAEKVIYEDEQISIVSLVPKEKEEK
jgi:hypothetical protein